MKVEAASEVSDLRLGSTEEVPSSPQPEYAHSYQKIMATIDTQTILEREE